MPREEEPPSPPHNCGVQTGHRVKNEPSYPPHRKPGSQWSPVLFAVKEELAFPPDHQPRLFYFLKAVSTSVSSSKSKAKAEAVHR